jgi:hypothetical protein
MPSRQDQLPTEINMEVVPTFDGDGDDIWVDQVTLVFPDTKKEIEIEGELKQAFIEEFGEHWVQEFMDYNRRK